MAVTDEPTTVELLALDPETIAAEVVKYARRVDHQAHQLTYSPTGPHSYYRDLLSLRGFGESRGASQRLDRHADEMQHVTAERRQRSERLLRSGSLEFRVEPNRLDGQGGYFSPPAWLNQLFATANRPGRVLSGLMARFPLPEGVSTVNLPLIGTGSSVTPQVDNSALADQDITDSAASSAAVALGGQVDVALQLLEQSPPGAHLDWAIFRDLSEAYDSQLESQLITGTDGSAVNIPTAQLPGILTRGGVVAVTYTDAAPKGSAMYPLLGRVAAQVGDARQRPPECWLMRTARWAWIQTAEDTATLPFGLYSPFYLGNDDQTPDPIGAIAGWPVFLNDAVPANLGTAGNQDVVVCLRPSDSILLEGEPRTMVAREPLSGNLGARIQMHSYAAALLGRRPSGIGVLSGTGMAVQSGF